MSELLPASRPPDLMHAAVEADPRARAQEHALGLVVVRAFLLLFGGTFAVGLVYLWLTS